MSEVSGICWGSWNTSLADKGGLLYSKWKKRICQCSSSHSMSPQSWGLSGLTWKGPIFPWLNRLVSFLSLEGDLWWPEVESCLRTECISCFFKILTCLGSGVNWIISQWMDDSQVLTHHIQGISQSKIMRQGKTPLYLFHHFIDFIIRQANPMIMIFHAYLTS
jgi:hypothetical protein